ncbi:haloacid dehalogenase type II [Nocardioides sp. NPDC051685]|uniref:haloacid dehalogenase type II n=1 Tax=Nocardioides sp. NPDC051685 TaxID=3364334 RepID=UPI0037B1ACF5
MLGISDIDVVVFDVLGTLVDQPGGLRAALRSAVPAADEDLLSELLSVWEQHVEREQQRIAHGDRAYVNTDVIDWEAAVRVADHVGGTDPATVARIATAGQRLPPWDDSVASLDRLARCVPVLALSNASRASLLRLSAGAGLRWHQVLSGETVGAYKPAPEVYRLAIDTAGCAPERVLMVAAHAWDLRGAQAHSMRAAYVARPAGNPPGPSDRFDLHADSLGDLVDKLCPAPEEACPSTHHVVS